MPTYREMAIEILIACQAIEYGLKFYISMHYTATNILLKRNGLEYGLNSNTVESASLERLVKIFSTLNANSNFKSEISAFIRSRNHMAHQALLHETPAKIALKTDDEAENKRVRSILVEATKISNVLKSEIDDLSIVVHKILSSL